VGQGWSGDRSGMKQETRHRLMGSVISLTESPTLPRIGDKARITGGFAGKLESHWTAFGLLLEPTSPKLSHRNRKRVNHAKIKDKEK